MKKRLFTLTICLIMTFAVIYKIDVIVNKLSKYFDNIPTIVVKDKNRFSKAYDYEFVRITEDFIPYNFQDLLNIFYTILDSGYDTFTFYCPIEYEDCISDVENISNQENVDILTTIGNYVSPYNNFTSLRVKYDTAGEVTVEINHLYTEQDILNITNKIDEIWKSIVTTDMKNEDIIYAFHDYIINHTKYDENYEKELDKYNKKLENLTNELNNTDKDSKEHQELQNEYDKLKNSQPTTHLSGKANGPLFEGFAICSGYTDVMAIILDKLGIPNFKVASSTHVWNALYIKKDSKEETWKHLDLTWDDPVSEDHTINNLLHKFFLIDTKTLEEFDIKDHTFNKSIYLELK